MATHDRFNNGNSRATIGLILGPSFIENTSGLKAKNGAETVRIAGTSFNEYEAGIWKSINQTAVREDVNLLCFSGGSLKPEYGRQSNLVYDLIDTERLDGLIALSGSLCNYIRIQELAKFFQRFSPLPMVSIGVHVEGIPSIVIDNKSGMRDLMVHLIEVHKYRRIAIIRGSRDNPDARQRFQTYKEVLAEYGIPLDKKLTTIGDFYVGSGSGKREVTLFFDKRKISFDALVCGNDVIASNAIGELKTRKFRVPQDVAVCGFDNSEESRYITPPLTTVDQPTDKLGEQALVTMLSLLRHEKVANKIILPAKLVVRRSCGCFEYENLQNYNIKIIRNKKPVFKSKKDGKTIIPEVAENIASTSPWLKEDDKKHGWLAVLLNSLRENVGIGRGKEFLSVLERVVLEAREEGIDVLAWNAVVSEIFNVVKKYLDTNWEIFNNLWKDAHVVIWDIAIRIKSYFKIQYRIQAYELYRISDSFISSYNIDTLKEMIINGFPNMGITSCHLCLYEVRNRKYARLLVGYDKIRGKVYREETELFPSRQLLPDQIKLLRRHSFIIMALFFKNIQLGFILFELGDTEGAIYEILSLQLSSALRGVGLMNRIRKYSKELEQKVKERTLKLEKAKESIEEANIRLKNLDKLKNDFIANITHAFRSPLTGILNIAELELRFNKNIDEESKENYRVIYKSSLRLKSSIDKLLELAKMDARGIKLRVKKVGLVSFLNSILDFYTSSVVGSEIKIIRKLPANEIEDFYTDAEKLEEIIDNIISNAIKFVDAKTGIITCELQDRKESVLIVIFDNGIGIPRDKLNTIFNRFEQAHKGKNGLIRGTGIGLSFAKQLIEYIKGNIWATSEGEGKGAQFFVELKKGKGIFAEKDFYESEVKQARRDDLKTLIESDIEAKTRKDNIQIHFKDSGKGEDLDYKQGLILIIDDDTNVIEIVMKYLKNYGYTRFITATDGKMGLEAVYDYFPDLIICDYNMPAMKGDIFHNQLLANPKFREIPFIFLSAVADERLIIERREKGARAYLKKPIDEKYLILTVDENLKKYFEYLKVFKLATIDELTALNNKRAILASLQHELAIRKYRDLSILFIDLDYLKEINDTNGHQVGDKLLSAIGRKIKSTIRTYDLAGRYGGDEFIILLPETALNQAEYVADTLRKMIMDTRIEYSGKQLSVTASFGVASLKDNSKYIEKSLNIENLRHVYEIKNASSADWNKIEDYKVRISELLIKMADTALYKAKHTTCRKCQFSSLKIHIFLDHKCPNCGSDDLLMGRNKVAVFAAKDID